MQTSADTCDCQGSSWACLCIVALDWKTKHLMYPSFIVKCTEMKKMSRDRYSKFQLGMQMCQVSCISMNVNFYYQ